MTDADRSPNTMPGSLAALMYLVLMVALAGCAGTHVNPSAAPASTSAVAPASVAPTPASPDEPSSAAPSASIADALSWYLRTAGRNRLPIDMVTSDVCADLFGSSVEVATRIGLKPTEQYSTYVGASPEDARKCLLNPELGEMGGRMEAWFGAAVYRAEDGWSLSSGECGSNPEFKLGVNFGCRSGNWLLETVVVNPNPENKANGSYLAGTAEELVRTLSEAVAPELARYPKQFYVSPYSSESPLDADGSDDPTGEWAGGPEACEPGVVPQTYGNVAQCVVRGVTALQVVESCRGAALAQMWAVSKGRAGRPLDSDDRATLTETCATGYGLLHTDETRVLGCPNGCSDPDGSGLAYIQLKGVEIVSGEFIESSVFFDYDGGALRTGDVFTLLPKWQSQFG